jgi:FAD/FMN-containing dehydrogenase
VNALPDEIEPYIVDWTHSYRGGEVVCFPKSTKEVSDIVKYCSMHSIAITPQGGNTGLVGGSVGSTGKELILSMKKMDKILDLDIDDATVTCEAGVILQDLDDQCKKSGLIVPLDLGAKGSCQIGGNVSTNAGGVRVLRYGSIGANVLGLEAVLADGSILDCLRVLKKDNTGYNLKSLLIGSEGTLGIITKVSLQLFPQPTASSVVLARATSMASGLAILKQARRKLEGSLTALEIMDSAAISAVGIVNHDIISKYSDFLTNEDLSVTGSDDYTERPFFILLEVSRSGVSKTENDFMENALEILLEDLFEQNYLSDAIISQNIVQEKEIWALRENVPVALMELSRSHGTAERISNHRNNNIANNISYPLYSGKLYKFDISLPGKFWETSVTNIRNKLRESYTLSEIGDNQHDTHDSSEGLEEEVTCTELSVCTFGHVGDGNMHLNILARFAQSNSASHADLEAMLERTGRDLSATVYAEVALVNGSISAEHGIGQLKCLDLRRHKSPNELSTMRAIKCALDPHNILNPGKILAHT